MMFKERLQVPWRIDPDNRNDMEWNNHIVAENGNVVCFMAWSGDIRDNDEHELAAKLFVAAPELLASVREFVEWLAQPPGSALNVWDIKDRALAAIAKATGTE